MTRPAGVAQLVEHFIRNEGVPGSSPGVGSGNDLSGRLPLLAMSNALHLTIRYEDAGDGWLTAQVAEVPGAISEGKTREEARANVIDALDVLLTPDEELAGGAPAEGSESVTLKVAS
jgi:predicted RNase H-like HicB family nuclease